MKLCVDQYGNVIVLDIEGAISFHVGSVFGENSWFRYSNELATLDHKFMDIGVGKDPNGTRRGPLWGVNTYG